MNTKRYLERIGINRADLTPSCELLRELQLAHIYSVPYENIDIIDGVPLSLDTDSLYKKIVERGRGGYCFELNSLFEKLLSSLGFKTVSYFARFWRGEIGLPLRRHRVIAVFIDGVTYIADVGIGSPAPRIPLLLREGLVQEYFGESYRFERDAAYGWVLYELRHGEWQKYFSFTEDPQLDLDFEAISYFCEHHPRSKFNKDYIVALKTPEGRKCVDGDTYKVFVGSELSYIEEEMSDERRREIFKKEFGI
jgi:N-hydroxyarylamine O-acetyltransferase